MNKRCLRCNRIFTPSSNAQKYCSEACRGKIRPNPRPESEIEYMMEILEKTCVSCGKKFPVLRIDFECGMKECPLCFVREKQGK